MGGKIQIVCVLGLLVVFANAAPKKVKFPPGFKKCPRITEEFNKCAMQAAKESIPVFLMGDRNLGVPPLVPLKLPLIMMERSANLDLNMTEVTITGLDTSKVLKIEGDLENGKFSARVRIEELVIQGTYNIDGKILILPIVGKGPGSITVYGGVYEYFFHFNLFDKNGVEYANMTKNDFKFDVEKAAFKLDGLFNGDKQLGDQMNKFLNENWKDVLDDFGKFVGSTVSNVIFQLVTTLFRKVPFDQFFSH